MREREYTRMASPGSLLFLPSREKELALTTKIESRLGATLSTHMARFGLRLDSEARLTTRFAGLNAYAAAYFSSRC